MSSKVATKVYYANIKSGSQWESGASSWDLFDRVINLKFYRQETNDKGTPIAGTKIASSVLRSDYEMVQLKDQKAAIKTGKGGYYFERMKIKPAIRVEYTMLPGNNAIKIKVYVSNFSVWRNSSNQSAAWNISKSPISEIEIHMGYFAQFPNFVTNTSLTATDYYEMNSESNVITLTAKVLAVYMTKTPPDSETCFECVLGATNFTSSSIEKTTTTEDNPNYVNRSYDEENTDISTFFFENVTQHFVRKASALASTIDSTAQTAPTISKTDSGVPYMITKYADTYGVKCYLTDAVSAYTVPENTKLPDIYVKDMSLTSLMSSIKEKYFPRIHYKYMIDGNIIVYDKDDDVDALESVVIEKVYNNILPIIPAVYSIDYGAVTTISAPFYTWIYPFAKVKFNSAWNSSHLVGYYIDSFTDTSEFIVNSYSVKFATVEDYNEIVMRCTLT